MSSRIYASAVSLLSALLFRSHRTGGNLSAAAFAEPPVGLALPYTAEGEKGGGSGRGSDAAIEGGDWSVEGSRPEDEIEWVRSEIHQARALSALPSEWQVG